MEIKFNSEEVAAIILAEAQKLCPSLNKVEGDNYRGLTEVTVSYEAPREPKPSEIETLRKEHAEQKQYIALMESPA